MSISSSENALSNRIAVANDDSRSRLRGSDLPDAFLAIARPFGGDRCLCASSTLEFWRAPR
jgi:hypothetical protein